MFKEILIRVELELIEMSRIQSEAFDDGDMGAAESAASICERLNLIESYLIERVSR